VRNDWWGLESLPHIRIPVVVPTQLVPLEEGNRHDVPSRRGQQPVAQAGVAEWLTRVSGEVGRAVELDGNAPVKERKIYGRKPIRRGVLLLVGDAQPVQALSDLSVPPRHSCIRQTLSVRSLCGLKHRFGQ
jgi:hypothetical protein